MASLKLFNANQSNQAVRPSFKERAAALRTLAARVVRNGPTSPPEPPPESVDWHSPPPGFMAHPAIEPMSFINIPEGLRLELERLRNIAEIEFERRSEAARHNTHETLRAGIESRLRRQLRLDGIQAALSPEIPAPAGNVADGLVYFEDASGKTHRKPVADWIGFTAQRLYGMAHQELSRQFNDGCGDLDQAGNRALDAKLRRELRTDALFALAFNAHKVFEAAQDERCSGEAGFPMPGAAGGSDPIFDALQISHTAKAAWDHHEQQIKGKRLTPSDLEEDRRLVDRDSLAQDTVYATTPTSRPGQVALIHWIREQIDNAGCIDGTPADGHESVWADGYRALEAALLSPPVDRGTWAYRQADAVNLSDCSIVSLGRLFEAFSTAADTWSDMSCLPFAEADEAASRLLDDEYQRASLIRDRIVSLLRSRQPKDDSERDEVLIARLRHELLCEGALRDQALLTDITTAWKA